MEIQEREVLARVESTSSKLDIALAIAEADALDAWRKYKVTEPLGIDFGRKMYVLRTKLSARGKEGKGFSAWLEKNHIPHSTAYFWIERYEVAEGLRPVTPRGESPRDEWLASAIADAAVLAPDVSDVPEYNPEKTEQTNWRVKEFGEGCEQRHEKISEKLLQILDSKASEYSFCGWSPWRPTMDSHVKNGYKPREDRYRVTLYLTAEQFEQLPDFRNGTRNAERRAAGMEDLDSEELEESGK